MGIAHLRDLSVAARACAAAHAAAADLLLGARWVVQAHALAMIALEEAGKIEFCLEGARR